MSKDRKTKDIFFGIVAIATLIVAIIGATLAYFSITASSNEGVINATSAVVSIEYNDGKQVTAQADELIPSSFEVVKKSYETYVKDSEELDSIDDMDNICIDSYGQQVCSAYRFTILSDIQRTITATLNNEHNGFEYLVYALYDHQADDWITQATGFKYGYLAKCSNQNNDDPTVPGEDDCYLMSGTDKTYSTNAVNSLFGITKVEGETVNAGVTVSNGTNKYDLVIFILETGGNQNIDQGKKYSGTIKIDVDVNGENGQITGRID